MPKFKVFECANVVFVYEFEAETEDDAKDMVEQGHVNPKETDFREYEVMNVVEVTDDTQ